MGVADLREKLLRLWIREHEHGGQSVRSVGLHLVLCRVSVDPTCTALGTHSIAQTLWVKGGSLCPQEPELSCHCMLVAQDFADQCLFAQELTGQCIWSKPVATAQYRGRHCFTGTRYPTPPTPTHNTNITTLTRTGMEHLTEGGATCWPVMYVLQVNMFNTHQRIF